MEIKLLSAWVVLLLYGTAADQRTIPIKLSSGFHVTSKQPIFYQESRPLVYEIEVPNWASLDQDSIPFRCKTNCEIPTRVMSLLAEIPDIMASLLPIFPVSKVRSKRSIDLIGDFAEWCCGVASKKSLDEMFASESNLNQFTAQVKHDVEQSQHERVINTQIINNYSRQVEAYLGNLTSTSSNDIKMLAKQEELLETEVNLEKASGLRIATTIHHMVHRLVWTAAITDCKNQQIPHSLIQPQIVKEDLLRLQRSLSGYTLSIPIEQLHQYFSLKTTSCSLSSTKMVVVTKIPLVEKGKKFELLELTAVPFTANNTICQMNVTPNQVIVSGDQILPLSTQDQMSCKFEDQELCFVPAFPSHYLPHSGCIRAAIGRQSSVAELSALCGFHCAPIFEGKPVIIQTDMHTFLIVNNKNSIYLACPGRPESRLVPSINGTTLEVTVPCGCHLKGTTLSIRPSHYCAKSSPTEMKIHHLYPAAWSRQQSPVIGDQSIYASMEEIINEDWPSSISHINMTVRKMQEIPTPLLVHVSTHLSLLTSAWMVIVTAATVWLVYRVIQLPGAALMALPLVRADSISWAEASVTMQSFNTLLLIILFLGVIGIFYIIRRSALLGIEKRNFTQPTQGIRVSVVENSRSASTLQPTPMFYSQVRPNIPAAPLTIRQRVQSIQEALRVNMNNLPPASIRFPFRERARMQGTYHRLANQQRSALLGPAARTIRSFTPPENRNEFDRPFVPGKLFNEQVKIPRFLRPRRTTRVCTIPNCNICKKDTVGSRSSLQSQNSGSSINLNFSD
jgi:hypothetical protein